MRAAIRHLTRLDYSADVVEGVMEARLGPLSDAHQRWEQFDLRVQPAAAVRRYQDGAGNQAHLITVARPHRMVEVVAVSVVDTLLHDPFAPPATRPAPLRPGERLDYLNPSRLVPDEPELRGLAEPFRPTRPEDTFEAVQRLMALVYGSFSYVKDVTTVQTTVGEVLRCRTGVCQDFAHVLLGLCRAIDVPARYVSGYIVSLTTTQRQQLGTLEQVQTLTTGPDRGAGASHAWVEAWTPTHGWRGFDPTNNLVASENHVKMAIGRDYADVPPTRGTFRGAAEERLTIVVETTPLG